MSRDALEVARKRGKLDLSDDDPIGAIFESNRGKNGYNMNAIEARIREIAKTELNETNKGMEKTVIRARKILGYGD